MLYDIALINWITFTKNDGKIIFFDELDWNSDKTNDKY